MTILLITKNIVSTEITLVQETKMMFLTLGSMQKPIEDEDASSAAQSNQLDYAFNPEFQAAAGTVEEQVATNSFNLMATNMTEILYAKGVEDIVFAVSKGARMEMLLARKFAVSGRWNSELVSRFNKLDIDQASTEAFSNAEADELLDLLAALL